MPVFHASVYVTLKPAVNDPQGSTIAESLRSLGLGSVRRVRAGKFFEIEVEAADGEAARSEVEQMCRRLLANPVIEEYRFEIGGAQAGSDGPTA